MFYLWYTYIFIQVSHMLWKKPAEKSGNEKFQMCRNPGLVVHSFSPYTGVKYADKWAERERGWRGGGGLQTPAPPPTAERMERQKHTDCGGGDRFKSHWSEELKKIHKWSSLLLIFSLITRNICSLKRHLLMCSNPSNISSTPRFPAGWTSRVKPQNSQKMYKKINVIMY